MSGKLICHKVLSNAQQDKDFFSSGVPILAALFEGKTDRQTDLHFKLPMTGELLNQNNWKPESSIKSTARESSLTVQTGVLPQITPSVCLDAETSPRMRKELPWLCTMLSACIGNRKLGHRSTAMDVLQVTK